MKTKQRGTTHLPSTHGWHVEKVRIYGDYSVQDRSNVVIADAIPLENLARLIAAAPDLLAAVLHVLEASEDGGDMNDISWTLLRNTVDRATGRERG